MNSCFRQRTVPHSEGSAHERAEPARAENGPGFRLWGSVLGRELQPGRGGGGKARGQSGRGLRLWARREPRPSERLTPRLREGAGPRSSEPRTSESTKRPRSGGGGASHSASRAQSGDLRPDLEGSERRGVPEEPEGGVASGGFGLRRSRHLTGTPDGDAETDLSEGAWSTLRQALLQGARARASSLAPGQNADRRVRDAPAGPQRSSRGSWE